jgi:ribosomal protein S18 acetylase RimI-like enzyme
VTGIDVRRVQPGEWAALRAVRLAALADAPAAFGSTMARELAFDEAEWRRRAASNSPTFIAWRAGQPLGLCTAVRRQEGAGTDSRPEWELLSMWVSPDLRGTGCADILVSAAARAVRAESAEQLTLWVADGNDRARAFYLKTGFRPTGIRQVFRRHDGSAFDEEKLVMRLSTAG